LATVVQFADLACFVERPDGLGLVETFFVETSVESRLVAVHEAFQDLGDRQSRQIGHRRCGGKRQAEPQKIVSRIADDRLVEIADLDFVFAFSIRSRAEISSVAVAADPDRRSFRRGAPFHVREPMVEPPGAAADILRSGTRHFLRAGFFERMGPMVGKDDFVGFLHRFSGRLTADNPNKFCEQTFPKPSRKRHTRREASDQTRRCIERLQRCIAP
jgi:hypothetical protein